MTRAGWNETGRAGWEDFWKTGQQSSMQVMAVACFGGCVRSGGRSLG